MEESVSKSINFRDLPEEVMEMIRKHLFRSINMKEVAVEALKTRERCHKHKNLEDEFSDDEYYFGEEESEPEPLNAESWTKLRLWEPYCENCDNEFIEDLNPDGSLLLKYYGMEAFDSSYKAAEFEDYQNDFNAYHSGVYYSPSRSNQDSVSNTCNSFRSLDDSSTAFVKIPRSTFDIDYDEANKQFNRLVKDWDLEVWVEKRRSWREAEDKFTEVEDIEPSLMMWNDTYIHFD